MGKLRCVDGSVLTVVAVACCDQTGTPYEVTLDLRRGRKRFASVGERCGFRLSRLAASVTAAREDPEQAAAWPDPDDRFPEPGPLRDEPAGDGSGERAGDGSGERAGDGSGERAGDGSGERVGNGFRPREREYFSLRSRDRSDLPGSGEFRCVLRDSAEWLGRPGPRAQSQPGGWRLTRRAVIEVWGADGIGLRAVLTSAELVTFLGTVLREPVGAAAAARAPADAQAAGKKLAGTGRPAWRQRGRVPDGSARSRLPALRT
jgi:hypothetical protein